MKTLASTRKRHRLAMISTYVAIGIGCVFMLMPFLWMLSTSLKQPGQVFAYPIEWLPDPVKWENYLYVTIKWPFFRYMLNSALVAGLTILGSLISCSLVAYAFSRLKSKMSKPLFLLMLSTMMLPGQVTVIPIFILFRNLGWIDSFAALTVPAFFGTPFYIFLLRQFFMTVPRELEDAARIDGCGTWGVFHHVVLPMAKPALAAVAVFAFMASWNDFYGPLIFLSSESKRTAALALAIFNSAASDYSGNQMHWAMAAATLTIIPTLIVFYYAQRFFVQGIVFKGVEK
ncbi:MAG: carbohydrate ABC transporter permease [Coriobacteriia bacterium]|nr:carbohydrate ABC transporter permease [Coriobacteriia bacterium]